MTDVMERGSEVGEVVEAALQEPNSLGVVQAIADSGLTVREQLDALDEVAVSPDGELDAHEARLIKREFVIMAVERQAKRNRARKFRAYLGTSSTRRIIEE